ncbi:hypothetical protein B0H14DRAFT_2848912 [Mycena olivaceomarginata]|nr:hypothetical protein B0H14DRAFT_2848912 [Mycena olivaceomarginata]
MINLPRYKLAYRLTVCRPITLALGITMPFSGVLIRYRANYTPKRGLHLEDEGFHETRAETDSYFGMMRRVHRLECHPSSRRSLPWVALSPFAIFLSMGHKVLPGGRVVIPTPSGLVLWTALHLLLSPAERAHPWKLYFAPGVGLSEFLQGLVSPTLALLLRFVPGLYLSHRLPVLLASLPVIALMTLLLTPLQVMGARLTLQRLDAAASADDALDAAPPAYGEEEVMEFRTQQAPYTGLLDCGRQMVEEEGWRALLRAWWVTPFFMVTSVVLSTAS